MPALISICSECQLCYNEDSGSLSIILSCGHRACNSCLQQLQDKDTQICPSCQSNVSVVDQANISAVYESNISVDLPANTLSTEDLPAYTSSKENLPANASSTLGLPSEQCNETTHPNSSQHSLCEVHSFEHQFWCRYCQKPLCKICLKDDHQYCDWILLEDALESISEAVEVSVERVEAKISSLLLMIHNRKIHCNIELDNLQSLQEAVVSSGSHYRDYQKKLYSVESDVLDMLDELKKSRIETDQLRLESIQKRKDLVERLLTQPSLPVIQRPAINIIAKAFVTIHGRDIENDFLSKFCTEVLEIEQCEQKFESKNRPETCGGSRAPAAKAVDCDGPRPSKVLFQMQRLWTISDPDTAAAAVKTLLTTSCRPSCILVTVDTNWEQVQVVNLLKVLARKLCVVKLRFLDTFLLWEGGALKTDEERLDALRLGHQKCDIKEFWGCVNTKLLQQILTHSEPDTIGIPLSSADDVAVLMDLLDKLSVEKLGTLHLFLSKKLKREDVQLMSETRVRNLFYCYLHCPLVSSDDLNWLVEVFDRLVPRQRMKIAVVLSLYRNSLTVADIDRLFGLLWDHGFMDIELQLDSEAINDATKLELQKQYGKTGFEISWWTDFSLAPSKVDNPTTYEVSGLARSTLPVLKTIDQARGLVEEVIPKLEMLLSNTNDFLKSAIQTLHDKSQCAKGPHCPCCLQLSPFLVNMQPKVQLLCDAVAQSPTSNIFNVVCL